MQRARSRLLVLTTTILLTTVTVGPLAAPVAQAAPGDLVGTVHFSQDCSSGLGTGISFDGESLWYTCYGTSPDLLRADPATGTVTGSWNIAGGLGSIAYDAGRNVIWAGPGGGAFANAVVTIPLNAAHDVSGGYTPAFNVPEAAAGGCGLDDGLAYDALTDEVYVSFDCSHSIYKYAAGTGVYNGALAFNAPSGYNSGVAIGGDLLYEGNDGQSHVWVVDKTTTGASYDFPTAVSGDPNFRDEGLTCDPVTFAAQGKEVMWSKEAYSPMRAAAFEIASGTCGFGGNPACTPDPTLVASVTRPALGKLYVDDVERSGDPGLSVVYGAVTVQATASDASRIDTASWTVDGAPIASGLTGAPWAATWHAELATPGVHTLAVALRTTDGSCPLHATALVNVGQVAVEGLSRALFATTLQTEQPVVQSEGAAAPSGQSWLRDQTVAPPADARIQVLHDTASTNGVQHADATSEVTDVSLLGGLVKATVLHSEAHAELDVASFTVTGTDDGSYIAGLVVNGVPIMVTQPNTHVPIPGVGDLVLDERALDVRNTHAEVRASALHFYPAHDGLRGEIILAQAVAGVDIAGVPFVGLVRMVDAQDDAGTGGDAGATYATGYDLAVGTLAGDAGTRTIGGRVGGADAADVFFVHAQQGEKIEFVAKPSNHVGVTTHTIPTPPAIGGASVDSVALPHLRLDLLDPDQQLVRVSSELPADAPQRIELNVNETGLWAIAVTAPDEDAVEYTLSASVVPIAIAAETPTGASCADAASPELTGETANSMGAQDTSHWYSMHAAIGDDLVVTLSMPDADGQDLDMRLYDRDCVLLQESSLGKSILFEGDVPKGAPDLVFQLPSLYTGIYYVEVTRYVGAGNYVLSPFAGTLIPTLPNNDALSGADASDDCTQPTMPPASDGAFEGRFEDNDPRDCYAFELGAGEAMALAFLPSPANTGTMHVGGGGAIVVSQDALGSGAVRVQNRATTAQLVTIELTPTVGGGNYLLAVGHAGAAT